MEVTIPVGFGLLMSGYSGHGIISGTRDLTRLLMDSLLGQRGVLLFAILVMSAALILTTSRGGIGSLAIGIAIATTIAVLSKGVRARELRIGIIAVVLALVAVSWLGSGQFSEKLRTSGLSSNRADLRELSYAMIADSPLTGTGVGTYRWIFPIHKDERFGGYFYEHAHNDFLEVLSEQGIVGFVLLALGIGLVFVHIVSAFRSRRDPLIRGALFASIAGCVSLATHGTVDFNLQIPANASYFFVLLGMGAVASTMKRRSQSGRCKPSGNAQL
jgi:O-antigen ligase